MHEAHAIVKQRYIVRTAHTRTYYKYRIFARTFTQYIQNVLNNVIISNLKQIYKMYVQILVRGVCNVFYSK